MTKHQRWRYQVTDVWGDMVGRIEVGSVVVDGWRGDTTQWEVECRGEITGGWAGLALNESTGDPIADQARFEAHA